jgi:tetratricopeptide (TPR) repeat protein
MIGLVAAVSGELWVAVGGAAAMVALLTALINYRTARFGLRTATITTENRVPQPRVQLPARSHLVNREEEMRQAEDLIRRGETVVAIEGDIGVGKSTVAKELAHRLSSEDRGGRRQLDLGGQTFLWIDGRDGCPRLVDICASLSLLTGDQSLSTAADDMKLDALRSHLATNKTVLVFDNLRLGDNAVSGSIRELLRTVPAPTVVIASMNRRDELVGAPVALEDLQPPHVRELIQFEAGRLDLENGVAFDEGFAARLQTAVGGNPGRIEWFLRGLRSSPHSIEESLEAVERGQGLSELFAPVWANLTEEVRRVLCACAYLRGHAILEQLAIACDLEQDDVSGALRELIEVGLVTPLRVSGRPNVFTCPHGVHRFVRFETPDAEDATFTERLAAHYIARFSDDWEDARGAIPHVGAIQPVLEGLFAKGDDDRLQALFAAILDILFSLGLFDARIATGTLAYESAIRAGNDRAASAASEVLSSTHAVRGEFEEARAALGLGLLAAERSGAGGEIARQMRCTGWLYYRAGQPEQALTAIDGAAELAREAGEPYTLINILNLRSYVHWYLGEPDPAEQAARMSLRVAEEIEWERAKAFPIRQLAEVAVHRREFEKARDLVDRARAIALEAQDHRHIARLELAEARLGLISGDLGAARAAAARAESEAARLGLPPEAREARALRRAARLARACPPLRLYYSWRRPIRLTDAPVV